MFIFCRTQFSDGNKTSTTVEPKHVLPNENKSLNTANNHVNESKINSTTPTPKTTTSTTTITSATTSTTTTTTTSATTTTTSATTTTTTAATPFLLMQEMLRGATDLKLPSGFVICHLFWKYFRISLYNYIFFKRKMILTQLQSKYE